MRQLKLQPTGTGRPLVALALTGEIGDAELRRAQVQVEDDIDDALEPPVNFGQVPPSLPGYLFEFVHGVEGRLLTEVFLRLPTPRLLEVAALQTHLKQRL